MKTFVSGLMVALLTCGLVGLTTRADEGEGGKGKNTATGTLAEVNETAKTLGVRVGRRTTPYTYDDKLVVKIDDKVAKLADVKVGTAVLVKLSEDRKSVIEVTAGEKVKLAEAKPEGKESPAPKRPEGKEAPAPKRPEGKESPAPKQPEGKEAPAPKRPEGKE